MSITEHNYSQHSSSNPQSLESIPIEQNDVSLKLSNRDLELKQKPFKDNSGLKSNFKTNR